MCDLTLWRYMDFAKLRDIIRHNRLFFAFRGSFRDAHEGEERPSTISQISDHFIENSLLQHPELRLIFDNTQNHVTRYRQQIQSQLNHYGISCWHINHTVNMDMMRNFTDGINGVVIKSSKNKICSVLENQYISFESKKVNYIDMQSGTFNALNNFDYLFHMPNYQYLIQENEYRFIIPVCSFREDLIINDYDADSYEVKEYNIRTRLRECATDKGFFVDANHRDFIESIQCCNLRNVEEIRDMTDISVNLL